MGACGLYLGDRQVGTALWEQTGSRAWLQASCPGEPGWIYRLVLQTDRGEHCLGVMLPEKDRFSLRRAFPAGEVPHRALIDRTLPGESHLPELPLALSAFVPGEEGLLSALWDDTRYLLFPLEIGGRCEPASFLCLTTPLTWEGKTYGVFCQKDGQYLPLSDRLRPKSVL